MKETRKIYKWWWVWDTDKEEDWLNEMAMNGWVLSDVSWIWYTFERCEPGEYIIRHEMRGPDEDYVRLLNETGAEFVARVFQWIYFRRKAEEGPFELFSDIDSRIGELNRIGTMLLLIGIGNLLIGIGNTLNGFRFAWINLICATLIMYGLGRIHGKKEALERERLLHE